MKRKPRTYDRERHNRRAIRIQNTLVILFFVFFTVGAFLAIGAEGAMTRGTETPCTYVVLSISVILILLALGIQGFLSWALS